MNAGLVKRSALHLSSPSRFGPWRDVRVLPDLGEEQILAACRTGVDDQRAEDGHLAELVIEGDAPACRARCGNHAIGFVERRHERLFTDDVEAGVDGAETEIDVSVGRSRDHDNIRRSRGQHRFHVGIYRYAKLRGRARTSRLVHIARADNRHLLHLRERGKVHLVTGFTEADDSNSSGRHQLI